MFIIERAKRARYYQGWIMQNRVYVIYIYMYVCMDGWYVCSLNARAGNFSKKDGFLGLTPVYSETTALSKPYFILKLQSMRKFLRKRLLSRHKKLIRQVTMALKTLFQTSFQNFAVLWGDKECRLLVVKSRWQSECRSISAKEATTSRGKLR